MAFNFHWSPLTADAEFYKRAQEMLTTALNKSPKPPIIVDDILVNELNLGTTPPELEILEIGDLAEDRFRGIFKMCYSGDAFLTLKTRVQVRHNNFPYPPPPFTIRQLEEFGNFCLCSHCIENNFVQWIRAWSFPTLSRSLYKQKANISTI